MKNSSQCLNDRTDPIDARPPGVGPAFHQTYPVNGTALWNPISYKEFDVLIPPGRKYKLKLDYENVANLTEKYGGKVDVDGVSVYVCLMPVEVVQPKIKMKHDELMNIDTEDGIEKDANGKDILEPVNSVRFCRWTSAFPRFGPGTWVTG